MNDQMTPATFAGENEDPSDNSIGASIIIDYAEIMASTEPDQPGGRAAYDSDDYETDEEADAALEAFFTRIIEAPYEENQTETVVHGPGKPRCGKASGDFRACVSWLENGPSLLIRHAELSLQSGAPPRAAVAGRKGNAQS